MYKGNETDIIQHHIVYHQLIMPINRNLITLVAGGGKSFETALQTMQYEIKKILKNVKTLEKTVQ